VPSVPLLHTGKPDRRGLAAAVLGTPARVG
jgi:hypothetical protein